MHLWFIWGCFLFNLFGQLGLPTPGRSDVWKSLAPWKFFFFFPRKPWGKFLGCGKFGSSLFFYLDTQRSMIHKILLMIASLLLMHSFHIIILESWPSSLCCFCLVLIMYGVQPLFLHGYHVYHHTHLWNPSVLGRGGNMGKLGWVTG